MNYKILIMLSLIGLIIFTSGCVDQIREVFTITETIIERETVREREPPFTQTTTTTTQTTVKAGKWYCCRSGFTHYYCKNEPCPTGIMWSMVSTHATEADCKAKCKWTIIPIETTTTIAGETTTTTPTTTTTQTTITYTCSETDNWKDPLTSGTCTDTYHADPDWDICIGVDVYECYCNLDTGIYEHYYHTCTFGCHYGECRGECNNKRSGSETKTTEQWHTFGTNDNWLSLGGGGTQCELDYQFTPYMGPGVSMTQLSYSYSSVEDCVGETFGYAPVLRHDNENAKACLKKDYFDPQGNLAYRKYVLIKYHNILSPCHVWNMQIDYDYGRCGS